MTYYDLTAMTPCRTYLVMVTETVVAYDIAQTIVDYDFSANVICAASLTEAVATLTGIDSVEIAFIAGCPARFSGSELHRDLVMRGARIVLLGIEAEETGPSPVFDVLSQPFDTDAVVAKLQAGRATAM